MSAEARYPRLLLSPPEMGGGEIGYIQEAFQCNAIAPVGPQLDAFEREFLQSTGFAHCIGVASGTAALHLALRCLGIGSGDLVWASTLTFIGGVSPVIFQGAELELVDCDRATWNMDVRLVESELEKRHSYGGKLPKAIVPTDLYGQSVDLGSLRALCDRFGIALISDSAESLGATYGDHSVGFLADASVFSFNGNKIITTSSGGMLASNNKDVIDKACYYATQTREPVVHFEHEEVGYNYRMSNICAAIGLGQLEVLEKRVQQKRAIFDYYEKSLGGLEGLTFMPEASYGKSNRWLTVVLVDPKKFGCDRETVRLALESENIESRPVWKPMHLQPCFTRMGVTCIGLGEVSEFLWEHGLCLPSGTAMVEGDMDRVCGVIRKCHAAQ